MGELVHVSKVKVCKEPGKGKIKKAYIEGFPEPIRMGVHGGIKKFSTPKNFLIPPCTPIRIGSGKPSIYAFFIFPFPGSLQTLTLETCTSSPIGLLFTAIITE